MLGRLGFSVDPRDTGSLAIRDFHLRCGGRRSARRSSISTYINVSGVPGRFRQTPLRATAPAREQRARDKFGRLGGVYLALTNDPQSTVAWAQGSRGNGCSASTWKRSTTTGRRVLHDRRIPGTRANIDHIAVTRSGVVWASTPRTTAGRSSASTRAAGSRPTSALRWPP